MTLPQFLVRTLAIAAKEVRQLRRDRLTGAMIFGIPLMQILIFGYGINFDVRHLHAGVVDFAQTSGSRALIQDLQATQVVDFTHVVGDARALQALLDAGEVSAALYIPPDFERRALTPDRSMAQLLIDGASPSIEGAVRGLSNIPRPERPALGTQSPRNLEMLTEYNPERRTAVQIVPGLIGVILNMTMVVFTAIAIVRERERGNLELLITTPVRSIELMIGKILPYIVVGLVQTTVVLAVGVFLFNVPVNGSLVQLYLGAGLFIAATLALGLLISTLATTQFQAMQLGFFTMLPSILLSGFVFPLEGMAPAAQWVAQVLPLTHFIQIIRGVVLRGADLTTMGWPVIKLSIFLAIALGLSALRFRKRLG